MDRRGAYFEHRGSVDVCWSMAEDPEESHKLMLSSENVWLACTLHFLPTKRAAPKNMFWHSEEVKELLDGNFAMGTVRPVGISRGAVDLFCFFALDIDPKG